MISGKLSIVMPAYNEAENIYRTVCETIEIFEQAALDFEILVVDDGSIDGTCLEAAKLIADRRRRVRVIRYDRNQGKGRALMCGARAACGEYIAFLDADMDLHPSQLLRFLEIMKAQALDVVVGSKFHPESQVDYPTRRRIYSAAYYGLVRLFFGLPIRDTQTGLKLFRSEVLRAVLPRVLIKRFAFDVELLANAHRLKYRIGDAPVSMEFRRRVGRIRWRDVALTLRDTLAIFYRMHVLGYYDRAIKAPGEVVSRDAEPREIHLAGVPVAVPPTRMPTRTSQNGHEERGRAMSVAVIGTGYVGLVTGACLAELGHRVTCIDTNTDKIAMLQSGAMPFFEPGLPELVERNVAAGRLSFSTSVGEGTKGSEIVFIAVGTPPGDDGRPDLRYVRQAAVDIARSLDGPKLVVDKSTVPIGTGDLVAGIIREHQSRPFEISVASNPEFLREGSAIRDFMQPDRIIVGAAEASAAEKLRQLYAGLDAPVIVTDVRSAELTKYAANAFLAAKLSFVNCIAQICEESGANISEVVAGVGSDPRIGPAFLGAGLGFGGSCFPKDVLGLINIARDYAVSPRMLECILEVNHDQVERLVRRVSSALGGLEGKRVGLLGLAFKPNTDDVRESQAVHLAARLIERGAEVVAHDPVVRRTDRALPHDRMIYVNSFYSAAKQADALIVATEWDEYRGLDLRSIRMAMRGRLLVDARNIYDPAIVAEEGLDYLGVGRATRSAVDADEAVAVGEVS